MPLAIAQQGDDDASAPGAEIAAAAIYLPIKPAFVVNYGGAGRLRYIRAELSVRLANADAANALRYHLPYVRNNLVLLFAAQTSEGLDSQAGKEKLRADALAEVRKVLAQEERTPPEAVMDVFFTTFLVQK